MINTANQLKITLVKNLPIIVENALSRFTSVICCVDFCY